MAAEAFAVWRERRADLTISAGYDSSVTESFGVVDCDAGKAWRFSNESTAVRYAAARHAATGAVIEVVRWTKTGMAQHLVLPPDAPVARPEFA
jgi:hypothetical protein